jgi:branched-chain amino acid aminotransferase
VEPLDFSDRDGAIWHDGQLVPWRDARLHVLCHSLHYGNACFEGERAYGGTVFKLTEHSARLVNSCRVMEYELPYSVEEIDAATRAVVSANGIREGYVRPIAWRGPSMLNVSARGTKPHLAIAAWPWPAYYGDEALLRGIRLMTSEWVRPSPNSAPTNTKAAGMYMICTLSRHAAERAGFDDALMLDYRGRVAEATGANIFFVIDGVLHTPVPDCILNGITRQTVMGLARARGLEVVERPIQPDEIAKAQEIFLTGTAIEVIPIRQIDRQEFAVGPVTTSLAREYHDLVRRPG